MTSTTSPFSSDSLHSEGTSSPRFHSMDALRGFALLLGVVFHAAESFCPERYSWAVVDVNAHWIFDWFQHYSHTFRMELFFLIAGFFAHLVYHRRGTSAFVRNRFVRIFLPFLVGWFLLYPAFMYIWIWGASVGNRYDAMGIPEMYRTLPVWKLTLGAILDIEFLKEKFNLLHLWFLHHLLIIYAAILIMRSMMTAVFSQNAYAKITQITDSLFATCVRSRFLGWIFPLITVPILFMMEGWGVDTANETLFYLPTLLIYGLFFFVGWILHRQANLLEFIQGKMRWKVALVAGFFFCCLTYRFGDIYHWLFPQAETGWFIEAIYRFTYASTMWCMIVGLIGLFQSFANNQSPFWRYVADSSYFIYLVHHLIVVSTQIVVSQWQAPAGLKFIIINLVSFMGLYLIYHFFVRNTWIGAWLNGRKYPPNHQTTASQVCIEQV